MTTVTKARATPASRFNLWERGKGKDILAAIILLAESAGKSGIVTAEHGSLVAKSGTRITHGVIGSPLVRDALDILVSDKMARWSDGAVHVSPALIRAAKDHLDNRHPLFEPRYEIWSLTASVHGSATSATSLLLVESNPFRVIGVSPIPHASGTVSLSADIWERMSQNYDRLASAIQSGDGAAKLVLPGLRLNDLLALNRDADLGSLITGSHGLSAAAADEARTNGCLDEACTAISDFTTEAIARVTSAYADIKRTRILGHDTPAP